MKFYTSVLPYRGKLLVRGINENGERKKFRVPYKPSLFVPVQQETKYKTLDGRSVEKITFENQFEARKWIEEYKDITNFEYFGNTRYQFPFIADTFPGKINWDMNQIRLMTIGNTGGWRNFANTKRQIANPSDMKGLKIRTVVADLPQELVRALGASPTPIPWPELFTSFQTGVVEGSKNGITDIMNMKFPDAGLKYVTLDGHAYMGALWWMNNAKYQSMPEDLRKVITDGFYALQQATFASPKRKSIKAYEDFVAGGGNLYVPTPDQKAAFKEAASPVYDWFKSNVKGGKEIFNALTKAVKSAEKRASSDYKKDL